MFDNIGDFIGLALFLFVALVWIVLFSYQIITYILKKDCYADFTNTDNSSWEKADTNDDSI